MEVVNRLEEQYKGLLGEVLNNGVEKNDRTGVGTKSTFGHNITVYLDHGFPLLGTKKMSLRTIATELKWFLKGDTNINYLIDNKCNIWNGDAYKVYQRACMWELERDELTYDEFVDKVKTDPDFSKVWGSLGPIYGKQWRSVSYNKGSHPTQKIDQLANLVENIKRDPHSRRLMVSAWNVSELHLMVLPPCHHSFQIAIHDDKMSLLWNQRSADLFLGVPFNIASYALLLMLLAKETGYKPYKLVGNFGDMHLYNNHIEQAKLQLERESYTLPELKLEYKDIYNGEFQAELIGYKSHSAIKAPLSN